MKISKKYWTFSKVILSVVFWFGLFPGKTTEACGPATPQFEGYSFFDIQVANTNTDFAPLFLDFETISENYKSPEKVRTISNIEEWVSKFCEEVTKEDMYFVVYKSTIDNLKLLRTAMKSKTVSVPPQLAGNSFADYMVRNKCYETVDYLIFAKKCEPYVVRTSGWSGKGKRTDRMQRLIEIGDKAFRKTKSHYIRLRYAFQIIRLAHYKKDYQQVLDLLEELLPMFDPQESIINNRILGHKAGALMGLKRNVEGSYLFSKIFKNSPGQRESAFRSFYIKTDEEWAECQSLCQNDAERATLYALRANMGGSKVVEELEHIYALNPKDENLEVLLAKEIKKLEKDLLGLEFNTQKNRNKHRFKIPRKYAGKYVIELQHFARRLVVENKVNQPIFWQLAAGYLAFLAGEMHEAKTHFNMVKENTSDKKLINQIETYELALKINELDNTADSTLNKVYDIIKNNSIYENHPDFPLFLGDKMTHLYQLKKHPGRAFRCRYPISFLKTNLKLDYINDLLTINSKENIPLFEKALLQGEDGEDITESLFDLKATYYFQQNNFPAALEQYKQIPVVNWDNYGTFYPFDESLIDCVNCTHKVDSTEIYNKGELFQKLVDLEVQIRAHPDDNALFYYQIGLALYNTSFYGHSWKAKDYYRTAGTWYRLTKKQVYYDYLYPLGNWENTDSSLPLSYFQKALVKAADKPEFAAKIAFMAAKCEQNLYFCSEDYRPEPHPNDIPDPPKKYRFFFDVLKKHYSKTKFYEEIIDECEFFDAYSQH